MVRIDHLVAGYSNDIVLNDVSFSVPDGKLYGVIGPNGAGKTTLVRSFFGISRVFTGSIFVDDLNILGLTIEKISSLVAVQRSVKTLDVQLSVMDYLKAGKYRVRNNDLKKIIEEYKLEPIVYKPIFNLSDGQMQRVNLAQAVVRNPRVFLLDEPTAHLDLKYRYQLLAGIKERLNDTKCAIAIIHDLDLVSEFCDRVVLMSNGKIESIESVDVLDDKERIYSLFGLETT